MNISSHAKPTAAHFRIILQTILRKYNPSDKMVLYGCASASAAEQCTTLTTSQFELEWGQVRYFTYMSSTPPKPATPTRLVPTYRYESETWRRLTFMKSQSTFRHCFLTHKTQLLSFTNCVGEWESRPPRWPRWLEQGFRYRRERSIPRHPDGGPRCRPCVYVLLVRDRCIWERRLRRYVCRAIGRAGKRYAAIFLMSPLKMPCPTYCSLCFCTSETTLEFSTIFVEVQAKHCIPKEEVSQPL